MVKKYKMIKNKIIKNSIWKIDWDNKQLILLNNDSIYFLPIKGKTGVILDVSDLPTSIKKMIIKQFIVQKNIIKKKKSYRHKKSNSFPILQQILSFAINLPNNSINLNDRITIFKYSDEKSLDFSVREKINYILQSYK